MRHIPLIIALLSWLILGQHLAAQIVQENTIDGQQNLEAISNGDINGIARTYNNRYQGIQGSPYWLDTWYEGRIFLSKDTIQTTVKYDGYADELVMRNRAGDSVLAAKVAVKGFEILQNNKVYYFSKFDQSYMLEGQKLRPTYLRILVTGTHTIGIRHGKRLLPADYQGAYNANRPYDQLIDEQSYYYIHTTELQKFKPNKKQVLALLSGETQTAAERFIKAEKLSFNNDEDLIRLFEYLNAL
jgi:hypothetical protein